MGLHGPFVAMVRRNQYKNASSEALVGEYEAIGERQQRAIKEWDNRTYDRLYPRRKAIAAELQSRPGDQRMLLLPLLKHPNVQFRLNAGQELKESHQTRLGLLSQTQGTFHMQPTPQ